MQALLAVVLVTVAVLTQADRPSAPSYPSCFAQESSRNAILSKAEAALLAAGYDLSYGHLSFQNFCHEDSLSCLGQNPSSPYGRYFVKSPLFLDEYEQLYQLQADEALIFYGCTPPQSRYFGIQTYAMVSHEHLLFADMGDSVNFDTINTTQPSFPFDTTLLMTTTGDQQARDDVEAAFQKAGESAAVFNTDIIPNVTEIGLAPMGNGLSSTIFMTVFRIADCSNSSFCHEYYNQNWTVIRATPRTPRNQVSFGVPAYKNRTTDITENAYASTLNLLVNNVIKASVSLHVKLQKQATLLPLLIDGRTCIADHSNCLGDTRDACYMDGDEPLLPAMVYNSPPSILAPLFAQNPLNIMPNGPAFFLSDDPNDFLIMVGVIHSQTPVPKATYTNIAVYDVLKAMGVFAAMDEAITGSAALYGINEPYYYAYKFARNCSSTEIFCYSVPTTFPGVPIDAPLTFVERAYVDPATTVGPDPLELLPPVILHFNKRAN